MDRIHTGLDVFGCIPFIGDVADGANALLYLAEGDYVNAALSGLSVLPGMDVVTKPAKALIKTGGAAVVVGIGLVKYGDEAADAGKNTIKKIRNGHLAGSVHPKTGVPFNEKGFPVFEHVAEVKIEITGNRTLDEIAANKAAGFDSTPAGYVWHHNEEKGVMQLVKSGPHGGTGHTGGFSINNPYAGKGVYCVYNNRKISSH